MSDWRKSSFCSNSGCVEVKADLDGTGFWLRSSRREEELFIDQDEWPAFIAGVKAGEFDE